MTDTVSDRLSSPTGAVRRRPPRSRLLNVQAECPDFEFELLELSPIGMSIETGKRLTVGDVHELTLRHKHGTTRLEGEVRWCRLYLTSERSDGPSPPRYRAGFSLAGRGLMAQGSTVGVPEGGESRVAGPSSVAPPGAVYRWSLEAASESSGERLRGRAPASGAPAVEPETNEEEKIEAIRRILEEQSLEVVFQPIYNLKKGDVFAYEALARSPVPALQSLPEIYRVAALAGLVGELGRQHRAQAVEAAPSRPLFLNVNPHEFDYGWLVQPDDPIFRHGEQVFIEVTENVSITRFQQCLSVLEELRGKGVMVAIDDLGAGFSNLRYLNELAPDFVKVDRSLISGVRDATRQFRLLESIVAMCRNLGSKVIAEGVEHADELVAVDHAGFDYCQGYLLGRPELPAPEGSWPAFQ